MRPLPVALVILVACTRTESSSPKPSPTGASQAGEGGDRAAGPFALDDREAVRNAVKEATGRDPGEDACFEWPPSFPGVVAVGTFAHDRGCRLAGLFVDRRWYGDAKSGGSRAALVAAGWAEADIETRQKLAKGWVTEVSQAFGGRFVEKPTTAFTFDDTPAFEPVRVRPTKVAGVLVSGWVSEPSGMVWESAYHFAEYRFGPDGSTQGSSSRQFAVDGQRIQNAENATKDDASEK